MLAGGLSSEQYDERLRSLGLFGPVGEVPTPNGLRLVYRLPVTNKHYFLRPAGTMTPQEREAQIDDLLIDLKAAAGVFTITAGIPSKRLED